MPLVWSFAKPGAKSPEMLRYTDLEEAIRLARAAGYEHNSDRSRSQRFGTLCRSVANRAKGGSFT
jgi:hypothetical protein